MPLLLALNVFVQLFFVVHVYRSGAPRYWVFVILAFPVVGCLAYFALEVFPGSREATAARRAAQRVARALDPDQGLRTRVAELELCGSIDNRTALAKFPNVEKAPAPDVEIVDFNERGPALAVRPYTHTDHYWQVYFASNTAISDPFGAAGSAGPETRHRVALAA